MTDEPKRFDWLLTREAPPQLYHYTYQDGLLGILESGDLWATKVQYMNDATEFSLATSLAKKRISVKLEHVDSKYTALLNYMKDHLDAIILVNICSVSFCENHDLLSQWRGYAGGAGGFAIGINSACLAKAASSTNGRLGHCIYNEGDQAEIIDEMISDILAAASLDDGIDEGKIMEYAKNFESNLIACGAFFKATGFKEESEWRLVTGPRSYTHMDFRTGQSMLIPYYKVAIRTDRWNDEITSITIGPCPHPEASKHAISGLCIKHHIHDGWSQGPFTIQHSGIPYRTW
jgi:hypothetical protein